MTELRSIVKRMVIRQENPKEDFVFQEYFPEYNPEDLQMVALSLDFLGFEPYPRHVKRIEPHFRLMLHKIILDLHETIRNSEFGEYERIS